MHSNVLKHLNTIREELTDIIDGKSEILLDSAKSTELQNDIQRNVIDLINETLEGIDNIVDSIDCDEYSDEEENED